MLCPDDMLHESRHGAAMMPAERAGKADRGVAPVTLVLRWLRDEPQQAAASTGALIPR